ncbi:MAG: hypothetical protein K9K32_06755 [Halanaerobiales bacterium]|nr:hypothetical protein [Halanaerobiales bacterium]
MKTGSKKLKINNCLDCKYCFNHPTKEVAICTHNDTAKTREINIPIKIKSKNIIPNWCPLENWNQVNVY